MSEFFKAIKIARVRKTSENFLIIGIIRILLAIMQDTQLN